MDYRKQEHRRAFLRNAFFASAAGAAAPLLSGCSSPGGIGAKGNNSTTGNSGKTCTTTGQLSIPTGRLGTALSNAEYAAQDDNGLILPIGFTSTLLATSGLPVSATSGVPTGYTWHPLPDGGACFPKVDGGWAYTSNSEVPGAPLGGAGALSFNADGEVVDAYRILSNTTQNCAGGTTPWNTWISGEEHSAGQCWECNPYQTGQGVAKPSLGLFAHEAVAVDMAHQTVYLTEDTGSGRFFRWIADASDYDAENDRLRFENGVLQVMNIAGFEDDAYPDDVAQVRQLRPVSWKNAPNPSIPQGDARGELANAGQTVPGTIFRGGEGIWFYELPIEDRCTPPGGSTPTKGLVFWTTKGDNRVWALDIENQLVEVIFDNSLVERDFSDVDNLTVSPWGDVVVAEDLVGTGTIRIAIMVPDQAPINLVEANHPGSEICGPAFSPDGRFLYFSSQRGGALSTGATYAIRIPDSIINA